MAVKVTGKGGPGCSWRIRATGLAVGLCLVLIGAGDCFAADLVIGMNQGTGQWDLVKGDLPGVMEDEEKGDGIREMDWEEEFTDTDTRRGILAVRGEVFQGFGGRVRIVVKEMEGGRETVVSLTGESDYMTNQELRPGRYQVLAVEADSDGRKFDCHVEPEEMIMDTGKVMMCRVFVRPGSVYQVTYEAEDEMPVMESGDKSSEQALKAVEGQMGKSEKIESGFVERASYLDEQGGSLIVLAIAVLGIAVSLYGVVGLLWRHQKGLDFKERR